MAAPRKEGKQSSEMKRVLMWEASQGLRGAWQLASRLIWGQTLCSATALPHTPSPRPGGGLHDERGPRTGWGSPLHRTGPAPEGVDRVSQAIPLDHREKTRHMAKGGLACPGPLVCGRVGTNSHRQPGTGPCWARQYAQRFVNLISGSPPLGTVPIVEMSKWKAGGEEPGSHLSSLDKTEDQGRLPQPEGLRLSFSQLPGPKLHTQAPSNDQGPARVLPKAVMPEEGGQLVP